MQTLHARAITPVGVFVIQGIPRVEASDGFERRRRDEQRAETAGWHFRPAVELRQIELADAVVGAVAPSRHAIADAVEKRRRAPQVQLRRDRGAFRRRLRPLHEMGDAGMIRLHVGVQQQVIVGPRRRRAAGVQRAGEVGSGRQAVDARLQPTLCQPLSHVHPDGVVEHQDLGRVNLVHQGTDAVVEPLQLAGEADDDHGRDARAAGRRGDRFTTRRFSRLASQQSGFSQAGQRLRDDTVEVGMRRRRRGQFAEGTAVRGTPQRREALVDRDESPFGRGQQGPLGGRRLDSGRVAIGDRQRHEGGS